MIVTAVTVVACLAITYSMVCRAALMDGSTRHDVRLSFAALATSSLAVAVGTMFQMEWLRMAQAGLAAAVLLVQWSTARHWASGRAQATFTAE